VDIDAIASEKTFPEPQMVIVGQGESRQGFIVACREANPTGGGCLQHLGGTDNFTVLLLRLLCKLP